MMVARAEDPAAALRDGESAFAEFLDRLLSDTGQFGDTGQKTFSRGPSARLGVPRATPGPSRCHVNHAESQPSPASRD